MKLRLFYTLSAALITAAATAQVKVGENPTTLNASAELEVESTTKGFLPPRLTTEQRDAIANPAEGLTIYNTTTKCLNWYNGTVWFSPCDIQTTPTDPTDPTEPTEPLVYCNISVQWQVYPITSVTFAGIANTSPNATSIDLTLANQDFTAIQGNVTTGQSYPIALQGTTGSWTPQVCYFTVFIDWNQDGDFTDANEYYQIGTVQGSTGLDSVQATNTIAVPAGALTGNTRMRVLYHTNSYGTDPCAQYDWAQAEDYTLHVTN